LKHLIFCASKLVSDNDIGKATVLLIYSLSPYADVLYSTQL